MGEQPVPAIGVHDKLGVSYRIGEYTLRTVLTPGTRRDWRGGEHIASQNRGIIVAANHISDIDPLLVSHYVHMSGRRPVTFMAKESLFKLPIAGTIFTKSGQIPVVRSGREAGKAITMAIDAIKRGATVIVYPEGTITRDPAGWPGPAKTGVARIAFRTGAPVIPLAQWGARELLPRGSKMPRFHKRPVIQMLAGPPVDLEDLYAGPHSSTALTEATERIMARITEQLAVLRGEQPA